MKIIVDAFGGDNAPLEIIKGCALAVEDLGIEVILTGDKNIIKKTAIENGISLNNIRVVHTDVVISPDDDASAVVKEKKNSSMGMGFQLLNSGEGFCSGNAKGTRLLYAC